MDANRLYDMSYTENRELSWLKFNQRVLRESSKPEVPLLERFKFLSIFVSNLDEFFMIRVGSLYDLSKIKNETFDNKTGLTPSQQIQELLKSVKSLYEQKDRIYLELKESMREQGIYNLDIEELNTSELKYLEKYFEESILPLLSPQIVDSHHPFPHLQNKEINIVGKISYKDRGSTLGIVALPKAVPRVIFLSDTENRYILLEKVILYFFEKVFQRHQVQSKSIISVTRNADISPEDEAFDFDIDFKKLMKDILKKRSKLEPVRLEVQGNLDFEIKAWLLNRLSINESNIMYSQCPLTIDYIPSIESRLSKTLLSRLQYEAFVPQNPSSIDPNRSISSQISERDILLSYPYESMNPFLELLKESASSDAVVSIKMTIYRLARKSKVIEYLVKAAENGKEVTVLIELRARFDEENNIEWTEVLEQAGCNIIYGIEDYKVHSKVCLITYSINGKLSYITQIGTGNYNEKTATLYSDLTLMTANHSIGQEALSFFNNMAIGNLRGQYDELLVAPYSFKNRLIELIDGEIFKANLGKPAYILIKANSITERDIIDKLAEASQAGVKIDLIIRGICCIIPEIEGKTDNIQVTSIVGRFLEHMRVFVFGAGEDPIIYISSADLMTRNLLRRVELACPIYDKAIKSKLLSILNIMLKDNIKAYTLNNKGKYKQKKQGNDEYLNSHEYFIEQAKKNSTIATQNARKDTKKTKRLLAYIGKKLIKWSE